MNPLSRGEIETLCVLHVVGPRGCPADALARRLGLSQTLAEPLARGVEPLVTRGLLELEGDQLRLTELGRTTLAERREALGV